MSAMYCYWCHDYFHFGI